VHHISEINSIFSFLYHYLSEEGRRAREHKEKLRAEREINSSDSDFDSDSDFG
jgi:hypothetical protein